MSSDISQNNKRIAKNTFALYFRTFITMIVGLYTGRVMLQALGVDNYGINAVVGGIVAMSSLITSTMSAAISRYITYTLGQGNKGRLKTMFSTSINAQIVMAVIVALVLEIAGVWFLNHEANIPEGRMEAANWGLQCSIALLQIAVTLCMNIFYGWYCSRNFEGAYYSPRLLDRGLLKELTVFSGWNLMNNGAYVFATQGVNMLVNVFFGVVYNASRSVAMAVNSAVQGFVGNFTMAFSPQITKSYAAGDTAYAVHLANKGTKFTWLMMYIFIVPVCIEAETLLRLWLGEVPELAPLFLRFAMFESLAVSSGQNLFKLIQADGHIKSYTVHAALTAGLIFPLVWLFFYMGAPVWVAYLIFIIDFLFLNLVRFYDLKRLMVFSVFQFLKDCIIPCVLVSVASFIVPVILAHYMEEGIIRFFVNGAVSVFWTSLCCIVFGLTKSERVFLRDKVFFILKKSIKK